MRLVDSGRVENHLHTNLSRLVWLTPFLPFLNEYDAYQEEDHADQTRRTER
jgi:hypothetical protein